MDQEDIIRKLQEELARAKVEAEQQRRRADEEAAKNSKTAFFEYLRNIQTNIPPVLRIETDRKLAASGNATKVSGKMYPRIFRPWVDFPQQHRQQFTALATFFGDASLFPSYNDSASVADNLSPGKRRDEQDIRPFIRAVLELPSKRIVDAFLQQTTDPSYAGLRFRFGNNALGTSARRPQLDGATSASNAPSDGSGHSASNHGSASPQKRKFDSISALVPDRWGLRIRRGEADGDNDAEESILPGEYKATHKLRDDVFRSVLGDSGAPPAESLIDDCAQRTAGLDPQQSTPDTNANADSSVASSKHRQNEMTLAQVLCQIYHYMIVCGTEYGYVTSGEGTVFLMVAPENAHILFYHYVDHAASAAPMAELENAVLHMPAAQMTTLILKALVASLRLPATTKATMESLPRWPNPRAKAPSLNPRGRPSERSPPGDNNDGSGSAGGHGDGQDRAAPAPPPPAPSGSGGDTQPRSDGAGQTTRAYDRFETPRKEYCTQACLLGLCRGGLLDAACPNTPEHARGERQKFGVDGQQHHAISTAELCTMLLDQLTYSLSAGVECLMKYGMFGAIGTLFKVTLCAYGYTFVAKGVQDADEHALKEEAALYADAATQHLQGVLMPVYLGCIELADWPYIFPSGACVWHMMLLSWVGVALDRRVPDDVDVDITIDAMKWELYRHGIFHRDVRESNLAWNKELGHVMALDFDRAFIMDEDDYEDDEKTQAATAAPAAVKAEKRKRDEVSPGAGAKRPVGQVGYV